MLYFVLVPVWKVPVVIYLQDSLAKCPAIKDNCGELISTFISGDEAEIELWERRFLTVRLTFSPESHSVPVHGKNCAQQLINTLLKLLG